MNRPFSMFWIARRASLAAGFRFSVDRAAVRPSTTESTLARRQPTGRFIGGWRESLFAAREQGAAGHGGEKPSLGSAAMDEAPDVPGENRVACKRPEDVARRVGPAGSAAPSKKPPGAPNELKSCA